MCRDQVGNHYSERTLGLILAITLLETALPGETNHYRE